MTDTELARIALDTIAFCSSPATDEQVRMLSAAIAVVTRILERTA